MARMWIFVGLALALGACQGTSRLAGSDGVAAVSGETTFVAVQDEAGTPPAGGVELIEGDTPPPAQPAQPARAPAPPAPGSTVYGPAPGAPCAPSVPQLDRAVRNACCGSCGGGCRTTCSPACSSKGGYIGGFASVFPGLGFGVQGGKWMGCNDCASWAIEGSIEYMDQYDQFNGIDEGTGGKWTHARLGLKVSLWPDRNNHLVFRGGPAWYNSETNVKDMDLGDLDGADDWFGAYVGLGYEWDILGGNVTTGPEVSVFGGIDSEGDFGWAPTLHWHILINL